MTNTRTAPEPHATKLQADPAPKPTATDALEATRVQALCAELAQLIESRTPSDGGHNTAISGLQFYRFSNPTEATQVLQQPAIYVVVQGRKQVSVGDKTYVYDPSQYLAVSLELPAVGRVVEATPDKPYLCLTLNVDARELAALIVETGRPTPRDEHDGRAIFVSALQSSLLDAFVRLVRLLDTPQDLPVLSALVQREINYRLLQGDQQTRLAESAIGDSRLRRVSGAIAWIKTHYAEPLEIEDLARRANMSTSALHTHFKAVTAMSPIQYQKRLRLQEARRMLLAETMSAETAAFEVGYASPSQFSREYARLFGQPPRRDAERLRVG